MVRSFLDLLYDQAPRSAFDEVVADAERRGVADDDLEPSCAASTTSRPGSAS